MIIQKFRQDQVKLQQTPPAMPTDPVEFAHATLDCAFDQQILDLADGARGIEPLWTDIDAIHD